MTANEIKARINEACSHFTFEYNGKICGIDPIYSPKNGQRFEMWYGETETKTVYSINDAMKIPLFNRKSLNEIATEINIIDF